MNDVFLFKQTLNLNQKHKNRIIVLLIAVFLPDVCSAN